MAKVKYDSTITGDKITLLGYANGNPLSIKMKDGKLILSFDGTIDTGNTLEITYEMAGLTGTDYSINYKCKVDGTEKKDPDKESPVEDSISSGNLKIEVIKIKC